MGDSGEASGGGRDPFGPVRWDLVPGRTAVVLIDLQRDFLHPDGWYAQSGVDIGHMRRVIEPTHELVRAARAAGAPLIWTRHGFRGAEDGGPFFELRPFLAEGGLRLDTWGFELLDDLDVRPEDWIVEKNRLSAFFNTKLELVLRALEAETVLVTRRADEPVRRRHQQGRDVPRLQDHRGRGVHAARPSPTCTSPPWR